MINKLDCRGLECPAPVLRVRDLLGNNAPAVLMVLVDNESARQNVSRFLEHENYLVHCEKQGMEFRLVGTRGEESDATALASLVPETTVRDGVPRKIMVLVTGIHMGSGDDGLGDMLMFNFLKTLKEMGPNLWRVSFVNSGVSFTAAGSEAVPILQELAETGVQITACGACLAFFHILDKMQVGEVTNMLEIVTGMAEADSVITL